MASGNPCGLSEISHFGTFQRVGGKAGGFISKKFFHPSSFRNQEKLWKAQTSDERERRKQLELERRRDEERQVEALRKQMYLAGQGKASDFMPSASQDDAPEESSLGKRSEQKSSVDEEKRRRGLLKQQQHEQPGSASVRLSASRYPEDVFVLGHCAVWGSWYLSHKQQWGYACCKTVGRDVTCPLLRDQSAEGEPISSRAASSSSHGNAGSSPSGVTKASSDAVPSSTESLAVDALSRDKEGTTSLPGNGAPVGGMDRSQPKAAELGHERSLLIDDRLVRASEERQEKKRRLDQRHAEEKTSGYLADLLLDPTSLV